MLYWIDDWRILSIYGLAFCYLCLSKNISFQSGQKSNLSVCSFMDQAFDVAAKNFYLTQGHKIFPMLSSGSFIALGFKFELIISFELIFESGVRYGLKVVLPPPPPLPVYSYPIVPAQFIKKTTLFLQNCF